MNEEHPNDPALTRPDGSPLPPVEGSDPSTRFARKPRSARSIVKGCPWAGAWLATGVTPAWAGRAIVGVGVLAGATLVGEPLGLGVTVVLLALGAIVLRLPRIVAVPRVDLRKAEPPPRDGWTRVWWAFAAALALVPVLRAADWVVIPCLLVAAALASLAATGGRRWGELFGGLGVLWARVPVGSVLAGRAAARGVSVDVARARRPRRGLRRGPAGRVRPAAGERRRGLRPADRGCRPDRRPAVRARSCSASAVVSLGGALAYVRLCPPRIAARPPQRLLGTLEWALPLGALVTLFARLRRAAADDAVRRQRARARDGGADVRPVRALGLLAAAGRRRADVRRRRRRAALGAAAARAAADRRCSPRCAC